MSIDTSNASFSGKIEDVGVSASRILHGVQQVVKADDIQSNQVSYGVVTSASTAVTLTVEQLHQAMTSKLLLAPYVGVLYLSPTTSFTGSAANALALQEALGLQDQGDSAILNFYKPNTSNTSTCVVSIVGDAIVPIMALTQNVGQIMISQANVRDATADVEIKLLSVL